MKTLSFVGGLSVCLGFVSVANAETVQGTADDYLTRVYATNLAGTQYLPHETTDCYARLWNLLDTKYYAYYKIDTRKNVMTALVTYRGTEFRLDSNTNSTANDAYRFVAFAFPVSSTYADMHVSKISFGVNDSFFHKHAAVRIVFESPAQPNTPNAEKYNCVLATEH